MPLARRGYPARPTRPRGWSKEVHPGAAEPVRGVVAALQLEADNGPLAGVVTAAVRRVRAHAADNLGRAPELADLGSVVLPAQAQLPMSFPTQAIELNGQTIHIAEEMNLTEMWKASGKAKAYKQYSWITKEGTGSIGARASKDAGDVLSIRTMKGHTGGTFAHWQIGREYARYLSPDLAAVCNQIVKDFVDAYSEIAQSVTARTTQKGVAKIAATAIDRSPPEAHGHTVPARGDQISVVKSRTWRRSTKETKYTNSASSRAVAPAAPITSLQIQEKVCCNSA